jgi:hypothetical protein
MNWGWLIVIVLSNPVFGLVSFYCLSSVRGRVRTIVWALLSALTLVVPAAVPRSMMPLPFLASRAMIVSLVKLYDIFGSPDLLRPPSLIAHLIHFANGYWLVRRLTPPTNPRCEDRRQLTRDLLEAAVLWIGAAFLFQQDWAVIPFFIEHLAKVPTLVLTTAATVNAGAAAWRLAGGKVLTPLGPIVWATTPAEFGNGGTFLRNSSCSITSICPSADVDIPSVRHS